MAALIEGDLTEDTRWGLALTEPTGNVREIVWPAGYSGRHGNPVQLIDDRGQVVASLGDHLELGGGENGQHVWIACAGTIKVKAP
jgi:hypothetical protein